MTEMQAHSRVRLILTIVVGFAAALSATFAVRHFYEKNLAVERARSIAAQKSTEAARKAAEIAALKAERLTLENQAIDKIRESAQHGHAILDSEGRIRKWNATLEKWSGYTEAELLGKQLDVVMDPEKAKTHAIGYAEVIADPKSKNKTFVIECDLKPRSPEKPSLRVRVTSRIVEVDGEKHAYALIDKARNVVELVEE